MTFKEFRELANGVDKWQVYLIDNLGVHWHYGTEEELGIQFDDLKVVSFDVTPIISGKVICTIDLI